MRRWGTSDRRNTGMGGGGGGGEGISDGNGEEEGEEMEEEEGVVWSSESVMAASKQPGVVIIP